MNSQLQLDVQALVDGELDPAKAEALAQQIAQDPEARALQENLSGFKRLLQENEPVMPVADSRDFYWSKIRRGIEFEEKLAERAEPTKHRRLPILAWLIPAAALTVAALFVLRPWTDQPAKPAGPNSIAAAAMVGHEIDAPQTGMTTLTFYSAQDSMTVVWVSNVEML